VDLIGKLRRQRIVAIMAPRDAPTVRDRNQHDRGCQCDGQTFLCHLITIRFEGKEGIDRSSCFTSLYLYRRMDLPHINCNRFGAATSSVLKPLLV
jgi:hypothetical protein